MPQFEYIGYKYANYPYAHLYKDDNGSKGSKKIHQIIFGDWVGVLKPKKTDGDYIYVRVRGENGWMHKDALLDERVLEIVFLDVGQGDGALIVTPDDEHIIVDAGLGDNMWRYLKWRYNEFKTQWTFKYAIASHPDQDHYGGYHYLAGEPNVFFNEFLHNGLLEYQDNIKPSYFGESIKTSRTYYTELFDSKQKVTDYLAHEPNWKHPSGREQWDKKYAKLLKRMLDNNKINGEIKMISEANKYLDGFEQNKPLNIQILGPMIETINGQMALRSLGNKGKTKNGHSIVFKLNYKDINILLGGDLNIKAEEFLMKKHTGQTLDFNSGTEENEFIESARKIFEADVSKACHHGSADFTSLFLKCLNSVATVISSGDEEQHSHPRPDTLGAIGVNGRGDRPLIFSTELARSHRENENKTLVEIKELEVRLATTTSPTKRLNLINKIQEKNDKLKERNVTVYGSINLRTDGERCIIAQKLEKGGGSKVWDIYKLEKNNIGRFKYVP
jgi:beta-lactamase superfamily II metal-dependent hydrolase